MNPKREIIINQAIFIILKKKITLPRRVRLEPQLSAVSSQLGHSQPQRPTVGAVGARSMGPSKRGPSTERRWPPAMRPSREAGVQESWCSDEDAPDPTLLQSDCSGLCNGFSRSANKNRPCYFNVAISALKKSHSIF